MKKLFFLLPFALLLLFPLLSAVEFNVNGNYSQGETIIAKVSGNFITSPTKDNVFFYEGHVRIPVDYGIVKVDSDYYIYASLVGKQEGNYSISIENVKYMKGNEIITDNLVRNFSITNETADFSINPGAVASSGDFSLELQSLKDEKITVSVKTETSNNSERDISFSDSGTSVKETNFDLNSGQVKKINFRVGNGYVTAQNVELSSGNLIYDIPVYIFTSSQTMPAPAFRLEPSQLILSIPTNSVTKKTAYIYNTGTVEVNNISLSVSGELSAFVNLSQYHIDKLSANSNIPIELSFFSPGETEVEGNLKVNIGQEILYSQISLKFLNDYIPPNETQKSSVKTCAELQGSVCASGETCDKETVYAKDNVCCLGTCTKPQSSSPAGKIIAIVLIILVAAGLFWFYQKKFKKSRKSVDLLKIAKGKKD